ncbi:MAG: energy transducer TonB [Candidatus Kapaibacterium sp.]
MASSNQYDVPLPFKYGAPELKEFIWRFTLRGFLITTALVILFLVLFFVYRTISEAEGVELKKAPISKIELVDVPPPPTDEASAPPPPTQQIVATGPAVRAGNPVPVPDAMVKPDMKEFATVDVQSRASAEGGDGVDLGDFAANIDFESGGDQVKVEVREEEPGINEFIPVEKQPSVDLAELQKNVKYPDMARRAGIEGTVTIRVLVDQDGSVRRMVVQSTDSELLNEAAKDAVKKTAFTPAIQNNEPVICWVSIPIRFKLR